jgi:AcrR family transcriptional regulator
MLLLRRKQIVKTSKKMTSDSYPAPEPRDRSTKANARRAKIVQAARELFAENGFHATGMARISERSGVLVGQIYRDFANKEAIVAELAEQDLAEFLGGEELCQSGCVLNRASVRSWIERFITCADMPDERLVSEIIAETTRNPRLAAIFRSVDERLRERLIQALGAIVPQASAAEPLRCRVDPRRFRGHLSAPRGQETGDPPAGSRLADGFRRPRNRSSRRAALTAADYDP